MEWNRRWRRPGLIVFLATILVAFIELIHLEALAIHGYPNSDQGEAAYYYNIRGVFLTIVCCLLILYILLTGRTGYYRAIVLWCMLIAGLCLCLVGVIRGIVWLSISGPNKLNEMGNHTRNRFEGGQGLSQHEIYTIKEKGCCGVKGIMIWRLITDSRKQKPDEHDLDEKIEFANLFLTNKSEAERKTAHVPDECCIKHAYHGCGEANFLKIIDYLEEPINIMSHIDNKTWDRFAAAGFPSFPPNKWDRVSPPKVFSDTTVALNISDPRILIPNDERSISTLWNVQAACNDKSVQHNSLFIYHYGHIYDKGTKDDERTQGAPCLREDWNETDCQNNNSIKFEFTSVREFCLFVFHNTMTDSDLADVIGSDGLLYTKECGSAMIPYIDAITTFTLIYSGILLILLICVMIVFHNMYIELRLEQLRKELPPRWYKPLPNEEGQILGFGDVPEIPESERIKGPDEPTKQYAKPPVGKYKGPVFTPKEYEAARAAAEKRASEAKERRQSNRASVNHN